MTPQKELSACCQAKLITVIGDEGTNYYSCYWCGRPCDLYQKSELNLSLCENGCFCITKTINGHCGKCGKDKMVVKSNSPSKQVGTSMSLPKQAEWEKRFRYTLEDWKSSKDQIERTVWFIQQLSPHNLWKGYDAISGILSKQEAEHEEEIKRLTINANDQAFKYSREIKKLKQQHLEELESLRMSLMDVDPTWKGACCERTHNRSARVINTKIEKLINSKKGK